MKRDEFSDKIKDQAAQRAGGHCEKCGTPFGGRRPTYDHILPCAFGGKGTLANCQVLGPCCDPEKTRQDIKAIRKSDRQRRAASGASRPKQKIAQRPKEPKPPPKPKAPKRRDVFNREI